MLKWKQSGQSVPDTLCACCPESVWILSDASAQCFCRATRHVIYDDLSPNLRTRIRVCDGYEEAMLDTQMEEDPSNDETAPHGLTQ
ncbi:MAG: hypothetical protein AAF851_17300 [Myxococcota bacterium]